MPSSITSNTNPDVHRATLNEASLTQREAKGKEPAPEPDTDPESKERHSLSKRSSRVSTPSSLPIFQDELASAPNSSMPTITPSELRKSSPREQDSPKLSIDPPHPVLTQQESPSSAPLSAPPHELAANLKKIVSTTISDKSSTVASRGQSRDTSRNTSAAGSRTGSPTPLYLGGTQKTSRSPSPLPPPVPPTLPPPPPPVRSRTNSCTNSLPANNSPETANPLTGKRAYSPSNDQPRPLTPLATTNSTTLLPNESLAPTSSSLEPGANLHNTANLQREEPYELAKTLPSTTNAEIKPSSSITKELSRQPSLTAPKTTPLLTHTPQSAVTNATLTRSCSQTIYKLPSDVPPGLLTEAPRTITEQSRVSLEKVNSAPESSHPACSLAISAKESTLPDVDNQAPKEVPHEIFQPRSRQILPKNPTEDVYIILRLNPRTGELQQIRSAPTLDALALNQRRQFSTQTLIDISSGLLFCTGTALAIAAWSGISALNTAAIHDNVALGLSIWSGSAALSLLSKLCLELLITKCRTSSLSQLKLKSKALSLNAAPMIKIAAENVVKEEPRGIYEVLNNASQGSVQSLGEEDKGSLEIHNPEDLVTPPPGVLASPV